MTRMTRMTWMTRMTRTDHLTSRTDRSESNLWPRAGHRLCLAAVSRLSLSLRQRVAGVRLGPAQQILTAPAAWMIPPRRGPNGPARGAAAFPAAPHAGLRGLRVKKLSRVSKPCRGSFGGPQALPEARKRHSVASLSESCSPLAAAAPSRLPTVGPATSPWAGRGEGTCPSQTHVLHMSTCPPQGSVPSWHVRPDTGTRAGRLPSGPGQGSALRPSALRPLGLRSPIRGWPVVANVSNTFTCLSSSEPCCPACRFQAPSSTVPVLGRPAAARPGHPRAT